MSTKQSIILLAIAIIVVGSVIFLPKLLPQNGTVACTTEAKLCPDGSAVGRSGPNCEFAACPTATTTSSVEYKNDTYGFSITLPESWAGFREVNSTWTGTKIGTSTGPTTITGPEILVRHPQWTTAVPRQDIPIMIFTLSEWSKVGVEQNAQYSLGAAPIGPSELGRNGTYVFALPARYNYAYLPGFEEVESILQGQNFKAY